MIRTFATAATLALALLSGTAQAGQDTGTAKDRPAATKDAPGPNDKPARKELKKKSIERKGGTAKPADAEKKP